MSNIKNLLNKLDLKSEDFLTELVRVMFVLRDEVIELFESLEFEQTLIINDFLEISGAPFRIIGNAPTTLIQLYDEILITPKSLNLNEDKLDEMYDTLESKYLKDIGELVFASSYFYPVSAIRIDNNGIAIDESEREIYIHPIAIDNFDLGRIGLSFIIAVSNSERAQYVHEFFTNQSCGALLKTDKFTFYFCPKLTSYIYNPYLFSDFEIILESIKPFVKLNKEFFLTSEIKEIIDEALERLNSITN